MALWKKRFQFIAFCTEIKVSEESMEEKLVRLNSVSSCFCLAKWLQVTIDLVHGTTHSCHHPKRHKVPLSELIENPSALHNTKFKKEQRKKMLMGERPSECAYCWKMEDIGVKYSDRFIKSTDAWSWNHLDKIKNLPWDSDVKPSYVEVMLDSTCNFSCAYCVADISTGVAAEIKKFGEYKGFFGHHRLGEHSQDTKTDAYRDAFFKWLPNIIEDLEVLRLTGGEPLLSPHFWSLMKDLNEYKSQNLSLIVNSHLCHTDTVMGRLISGVQNLLNEKKIKDFSVFVSLDTYKEQAEYIRSGLNYDRVKKNLERIAEELPNTEIVIMCTFNILSISKFDLFLQDLVSMKKNFPIVLDVSYLRDPEYLAANLATPELVSKMKNSLRYMKNNNDLFNDHEITKFENVINWVESPRDKKEELKSRGNLFRFLKEYDRRKNKNFLELFPDYQEFMKICKVSALDHAIGDNGAP